MRADEHRGQLTAAPRANDEDRQVLRGVSARSGQVPPCTGFRGQCVGDESMDRALAESIAKPENCADTGGPCQ